MGLQDRAHSHADAIQVTTLAQFGSNLGPFGRLLAAKMGPRIGPHIVRPSDIQAEVELPRPKSIQTAIWTLLGPHFVSMCAPFFCVAPFDTVYVCFFVVLLRFLTNQ